MFSLAMAIQNCSNLNVEYRKMKEECWLYVLENISSNIWSKPSA